MSKKLSIIEFINESNIIHNNKYDYSKTIYINCKEKVEIICPIHGSFFQTPDSHLHKKGCCYCGNNIKKSSEQFIKEASIIHNNKYNYSKINYKTSKVEVEIICPIHGSFFQTPDHHINGKQGCRTCNISLNTIYFIDKANKIHKNKYNYSKVNYTAIKNNVEIICPKHGSFYQRADSHLNGHGCIPCNVKKYNISMLEDAWIDSLNNKNIIRNKKIILENGEYVVPDGYDPVTNTIYEFYGDYWHGNPKRFKRDDLNTKTKTTFGYLYNCTIDKETKLKKYGFNLVSLWEYDWLNR